MIYKALTVISCILLQVFAFPAGDGSSPAAAAPEEINNLNVKINPRERMKQIIDEVEQLIQSNSSFPRLTRGEIIDLVDNLTRSGIVEDYKKRGEKALTLVMPYTVGDKNQNNIEQLFTKEPVTKIVGSDNVEVTTEGIKQKPKFSVGRLRVTTEGPSTEKSRVTESEANDASTQATVSRTPVRRRRPIYSAKKPVDAKQTESSSKTVSSKPNDSKPNASTPNDSKPHDSKPNDSNQIQSKPVYSKPVDSKPSDSKSANSKPAYSKPNDSETSDWNPINSKPIDSNQNDSNDAKPNDFKPVSFKPSEFRPIFTRPKFPNHRYPDDTTTPYSITQSKSTSNYDQSAQILNINELIAQQSQSTKKPLLEELQLPENIRNAVKDIDLLMYQAALAENTNSQKYTTPKYSAPKRTTPKYTLQKPSLNFSKQKLPSQTNSNVPEFKPIGNVEMPQVDVGVVSDTLSPKMQELLSNFGLIPGKETPTSLPVKQSFEPEGDPIKPESFQGFKPVAGGAPADEEMEKFLAQFGLGGRKEKAIRVGANNKLTGGKDGKAKTKQNGFNEEEIKSKRVTNESKANQDDSKPNQSKSNQNSKTNQSSRSNQSSKNKQNSSKPNKNGNQSLSKPTDQLALSTNEDDHATLEYIETNTKSSQKELDQINQLMELVKQLEQINGTATEDDLNHIDIEGLKALVSSMNQEKFMPLDQQSAPNPLNFDFGLSKNEVKRQEITTTAPVSESPTTVGSQNSEVPKPSSSDESKNSNIEALAESFGGNTESELSSLATEPAPTTRKTGFYYLVDWNSFFDIDNQKGRRVNLRFQPTIGDPKQFYSVNVP